MLQEIEIYILYIVSFTIKYNLYKWRLFFLRNNGPDSVCFIRKKTDKKLISISRSKWNMGTT